MEKQRKIALVGRKIGFEEAEEQDILFWASKSWRERLEETERLRRLIWTHLLGSYPSKMEKVGRVIKKSNSEEE
jgi:hypothetical protein